ncbi:MAG: prolyl oligopeptidase, partial [Nitriliruptoraceae bacterium]
MSPDDPTVARRGDLVETLHGVEVADPYRWMEEQGSPELHAWIDAVASHADGVLALLPGRDTLLDTLRAAQDVARCAAPWRKGGWWFHARNTGLQDHAVLWCASVPVDEDGYDELLPPTVGWRVLLDPNGWDGARSLGPVEASPDGSRLAYAVSEAGSDWHTWSVIELATGDALPDTVPWSKFAGAAWLPDGSGFLTCTYPAPAAGDEHAAAVHGHQLVLHRLGGDTSIVHTLPDEPETGFTPQLSHDGRWLLLTLTRGTDPETRVHVARITRGADGTAAASIGEVRPLLDDGDAMWWPIGVVTRAGADELWCLTDSDAPRRRVVAIGLADGARREVLAESADQLEEAHLAGASTGSHPGWLLSVHLHHAASRVTVHDLAGRPQHEVNLGALVSVGAQIGGEVRTTRRDGVIHLVTTSFDRPTRLLRHDPTTGVTTSLDTELRPVAATDDATDLVVERVFVRSASSDDASDAVAVPVFLVRRRDVVPTGATPTVLWGYGGFNIAVTPHFRVGWRTWVEHGGLLAVACLRGGSEYGRAWYDDGRLANKQHVFDDALAVAAWLCGEGAATDDTGAATDDTGATTDETGATTDATAWTSPAHLGIEGRSNGGLLAAACLTQAPQRFGSVVPEVGVHDMLRFHRFTIGWAWTSDYGDPDTPDGLRDALAYSPLHRVEVGARYPPTLITTGDTDDRVVPAHSFKLAATLLHAQAGDAPIVLRVDRSAGHGAGKPTSQVLAERADVLAWHAHHLGLPIE